MGIWSLPRWFFFSLLYTLPSIVCFGSCVLSGQCGKLPVQLCWREHFSALRALFSPRCRINGIPLQSWEVASASYLAMFVLLDGDVFRRNTRQYLESSKYNANSSWNTLHTLWQCSHLTRHWWCPQRVRGMKMSCHWTCVLMDVVCAFTSCWCCMEW